MKGDTGVMGPPGAQGMKGDAGKPGLPGKSCAAGPETFSLGAETVKVTMFLMSAIHCRFGWISWS